MFAAIPFPDIDPIAISIGPFAIHWYSLAYIFGLILGWLICRHMANRYSQTITVEHIDDMAAYAAFGVILGGRLGYVLFYNFQSYLNNPIEIFFVWEGGMSFHGGFIGVAVAILVYARKKLLSPFELADMIVAVAPIGLLLGRITNFVNAELYGRITDVPWGVIFPTSRDGLARHPSQLYEAGLEGLLLGILLLALYHVTKVRERFGTITGLFFLGYGCSRFFVEFFREPDAHLGFLFQIITMGQLLSLPLIMVGLVFVLAAPKINGKNIG